MTTDVSQKFERVVVQKSKGLWWAMHVDDKDRNITPPWYGHSKPEAKEVAHTMYDAAPNAQQIDIYSADGEWEQTLSKVRLVPHANQDH